MDSKEILRHRPICDYSSLEKQVIAGFGPEKMWQCLDEALYCLAAWSPEDPGDPAFTERYHPIWEPRNTLGKLKRRG